MNRLKITTSRYWYKVNEMYPILGYDKDMGFMVDANRKEGAIFFVQPSDCSLGGEQADIFSAKYFADSFNIPVKSTEELLIKLIPNSEGKCVDFPVKLEQGDWIDLRACFDRVSHYSYDKGDKFYISLGIAVKLPTDYEAYIVARSSLGKKKSLILINGQGIIDNSYNGNYDCWGAWFYAIAGGFIEFNERICQFRIQKNQPTLKLTQVDNLEGVNRGGFGEGTKNEK